MPRYDLLVDGEKEARVKGEDAVREWLRNYCDEHEEDDPSAVHVQIIRVRLLGGGLVPREQFL